MRRPLLVATVTVVCGILAADRTAWTPAGAAALAGFFCVVGWALLGARRRAVWVFLAALAALGLTSAAWTLCRRAERRGPELSALIGPGPRCMRVRGVAADAPETLTLPPRGYESEPRTVTRFLLAVEAYRAESGWRPIRGRLRVTTPGVCAIERGRGIEMMVRARAAGPAMNPGETDPHRRLARQGVAGYAEAAGPGALRPYPEADRASPLAVIHRIRKRAARGVEAGLPADRAALVKCLALGERHALRREQEAAYQRTGTVHYLSVSGLHVGLVALLCWRLALLAGARLRGAAAFVVAAAFAYALLAGFSPSAQRAAIMCGVVCGAYLFGRRPHWGNSLALALGLILAVAPEDLFEPGLQLSFAAAGGIIAFAGPLARRWIPTEDVWDRLRQSPALSRRARWLKRARVVAGLLIASLTVSLAAWLFTQPLVLQHFSVLNLGSPVTTLLLMPIMWVLLVAGLAGAVVAQVSGLLATPLLAVAGVCAAAADGLVKGLAGAPGMAVWLPQPGWGWVALCGAAACVVAWRNALRLRAAHVAMVCLVPAIVYVWGIWLRPAPRRVRITAVAVGEGGCTAAQFPNGRTLLFDAGSKSADRAAESRLARPLWAVGVRRLDAVVLSHADADHYNGVLDLMERIPVGAVATPPGFDLSPGGAALLEELRRRGVQVIAIAEGDRLAGFGTAECEVLWPPRSLARVQKMTPNERSLVLRLHTPEGTALFTGDVDRRGARLLQRRHPGARADVFFAPHHGLPSPEGERLARDVRPAVTVIPGGRYAEPDAYAASSHQVFRTEERGMISVELRGADGPRVTTFRRAADSGIGKELP